ncbi:unnamed protein product [Urochloa humidicola]
MIQSLKQLVLQYHEQINNYGLTMRLNQTQQNKSIPVCFNPDVF